MNSSENGKIFLTSFLQKRSKIFHFWNNRFCVLTEKYLITYKGTAKNSECTESINLADCSNVREADQYLGKNYSFELVHRNRSYYFICKKKEEQEEWIEAIEHIIEINNEIKNNNENNGNKNEE